MRLGLNGLKGISDLVIIFGTTSNINRLFRCTGGNKINLTKFAGIIFGLSCGCWAAGRFNNAVDAIDAAIQDALNEKEESDE